MENKEAILKGPPAAHAAAAASAGLPGARAGAEAAESKRPANPAEARPYPPRLARAEAAAWRCPFKKGGGGTAARPTGVEPEESVAAAARSSSQCEQSPGEADGKEATGSARQRRPEPTGRLTRRRETGARQHGALSDHGAPRLARGATARPHRGARLRAGAPGSATTAQRKGENAAAAAKTAGLGRPGRALGDREWGRPRGRQGRKRNRGESFIFRLEKWREQRPFFKLGLGRDGGCATSAVRLAPPPLRARQAAPAQAPGPARGLLAPLKRPTAPSSPHSPLPSARPVPPARPERRSPRPARAPSAAGPGARGAPAGPASAGRAAPRQARPPPGRASREAANMAPSVTQPPPPSLAAGHTHTRFSGKGPRRARTSKFPFPHPTAFPRRPRGPAGAKELIPRARSPPSTPARLPAFPVRARELRPSPSRSRRTRGPGPAGGHHYMQVIGGERAPNGGSAYSCRGPVPQLQVDPPLHVHVSLFPPLQT